MKFVHTVHAYILQAMKFVHTVHAYILQAMKFVHTVYAYRLQQSQQLRLVPVFKPTLQAVQCLQGSKYAEIYCTAV